MRQQMIDATRMPARLVPAADGMLARSIWPDDPADSTLVTSVGGHVGVRAVTGE